ncbi:hypothetical protein [Leptospira noguchii]|nr:hypothetical protein [Leptospira noguchii]
MKSIITLFTTEKEFKILSDLNVISEGYSDQLSLKRMDRISFG